MTLMSTPFVRLHCLCSCGGLQVQSAVTNALESVGQSAFSLLKGKIGPSSPSRGGAANAPNAVEHDREGNAADAVSFATKFDEHGGQSHLDALRLLATTADARASALLDLRQVRFLHDPHPVVPETGRCRERDGSLPCWQHTSSGCCSWRCERVC
eukprot:m.919788 g.919788  ORF g.919788 m.919788 type:complete len:155 (-) comp23754_c0_seq14:3236-3700(-)